jgi:hypothetical protein
MNEQIKARIQEIDELIAKLKAEKECLNPYGNLKDLGNKYFGETWSEEYICSKVPAFTRCDQKGWDLSSSVLGRVEVKSSRLPCKQITFNQCHPYECDYFLFVEYDTEEIIEHIFLVPAADFFLFGVSKQHTRNTDEEAECFTLSGTTKKNKELLENYRIKNWAELNRLAGGNNG